ncbi:MAG: hypothetical protein FWC41_02650 [Firmicutes bacterium]|nr:hypothetical protein [Bacillota bacterium]
MILKKLEIKKINLFLKISSDEAKSCAVRFASISSLIFLILKITKLESRVKDFNLKVYPDFLSEKTSANFEILLRLKIFWILYFLLCGTLEYVKIRKLK